MSKQNWEVHVTRCYIVEARTVEDARVKGLACNIGQTADFEFGGMKITTFKYSKPIKKNGCLSGMQNNPNVKVGPKNSRKCEYCGTSATCTCNKPYITRKTTIAKEGMGPLTAIRRSGNGDTASKRTNRCSGEEHEYIDFSKTDGV